MFGGGLISTAAYVGVVLDPGSLAWLTGLFVSCIWLATLVICSDRSLIWFCILELVSSTSSFISIVNFVIWLSNVSLIVSMIAVSSRSSSRNAVDQMALIAFFGRPAIAVI